MYYTTKKLKNSLLCFIQYNYYKKFHGKKSFEEFSKNLSILYNIMFCGDPKYFVMSYYEKTIAFIDRVGVLESSIIIRTLDVVNKEWRKEIPEI